MRENVRGSLLCITGVLLLSPDVLVMRWVDVDHSEVLYWRGLFLTIGFALVTLMRYRSKCLRALLKAGWAGVGCGLCFAMSTYCFTLSVQQTSATAAMMIIGTAPVFAAIISWWVMGEHVTRQTMIVIVTTLLGIAIISSDKGGLNSLAGNLYALATAVFMAANFNLTRLNAPRDITPGLLFGGVFTMALAVIGGGLDLQVDVDQIKVIALLCVVLLPIGFTMLQFAPRYISATDVSLFMILESVIGPIWVWLVLDEIPAVLTLIGSLIIIMALMRYAFFNRSGKKNRLH